MHRSQACQKRICLKQTSGKINRIPSRKSISSSQHERAIEESRRGGKQTRRNSITFSLGFSFTGEVNVCRARLGFTSLVSTVETDIETDTAVATMVMHRQSKAAHTLDKNAKDRQRRTVFSDIAVIFHHDVVPAIFISGLGLGSHLDPTIGFHSVN